MRRDSLGVWTRLRGLEGDGEIGEGIGCDVGRVSL